MFLTTPCGEYLVPLALPSFYSSFYCLEPKKRQRINKKGNSSSFYWNSTISKDDLQFDHFHLSYPRNISRPHQEN